MGLLRILTNSLCTLGARPQLPHVTGTPGVVPEAYAVPGIDNEPKAEHGPIGQEKTA
jgi:hypothetical protein